MSAVARVLWNPIMAKEYRSRMRTWRAPLAMTVHILLLGGIGWAVFSAIASTANGSGLNNTNYGQLGQMLFTFLIIFQVALISFITPALTAGAISGERERQTIDLLFVTPLPPFSVIWGKLLASMSFAALLLLLSVPIFSLVFLFGGIELDQMVEAFLVSGVTALMLGLVGIACSTVFKRTLVATVAAYGAAFVLLVGSLLYGILFPTDVDPQSPTLPAPPAVTLVSPVLPLITLAANAPFPNYGVRYPNGGPFPVGGGGFNQGGSYCYTGPNGNTSCYATSGSVKGGVPVNTFNASQNTGATITTGFFKGWQYWQASIVIQLVICLIALTFSALWLPPVRSARWRLRMAAEAEPAVNS